MGFKEIINFSDLKRYVYKKAKFCQVSEDIFVF